MSSLSTQLEGLQKKVEEGSGCIGTAESSSGSLAVNIDLETVFILLAVYFVISTLWGFARIVHYWWTGPNGGRFPADAFLAAGIIWLCGAAWTAVKTKLSQPIVCRVKGSKAARTPPKWVVRSFLRKKKESAISSSQASVTAVTELSTAGGHHTVELYVTKLSPVLSDQLEEWVHQAAPKTAATTVSSSGQLYSEDLAAAAAAQTAPVAQSVKLSAPILTAASACEFPNLGSATSVNDSFVTSTPIVGDCSDDSFGSVDSFQAVNVHAGDQNVHMVAADIETNVHTRDQNVLIEAVSSNIGMLTIHDAAPVPVIIAAAAEAVVAAAPTEAVNGALFSISSSSKMIKVSSTCLKIPRNT
jgi:hypothetical protein